MIRNKEGFKKLYKEKLSPEIMNFLEKYKTACKDNVLSDKEKTELVTAVKDIIYYSLYLRFQIERSLVDR